MAANKSDYLKNAIVQHTLGIPAYDHAGYSCYLALFVTDPQGDGSGTEVSGGSYVRKIIDWGTAADGIIANDAAINFTGLPATAINYWAIYDAVTGGNMLYYGPLSTGVVVPVGGTFDVLADNLIIEEALQWPQLHGSMQAQLLMTAAMVLVFGTGQRMLRVHLIIPMPTQVFMPLVQT